MNGQHYGASLRDLPTSVESYKTYDGLNLVKSADVGQILVVSETDEPPYKVIRVLGTNHDYIRTRPCNL